MLNIIIAGVLAYGVLIGVDKMLNYGKENDLYVEGYLQKQSYGSFLRVYINVLFSAIDTFPIIEKEKGGNQMMKEFIKGLLKLVFVTIIMGLIIWLLSVIIRGIKRLF